MLFNDDLRGSLAAVPAPIVCILAKEPVAGRVKTRLVPALTAEQAARLHHAFVADTLAAVAEVAAGLAAVRLAVSPDGAAPTLTALAAVYGAEVVSQGDGDLGRRMERVMAGGLADGHPTVLLGADTPDLPETSLRAAFEALAAADLVVGPALDGGYYLIAASNEAAIEAGAFEIAGDGAVWGGDRVFAATMARAEAAGLRSTVLDEWRDVDDAGDLDALVHRIDSGDARPRETARLLADIGRLPPDGQRGRN